MFVWMAGVVGYNSFSLRCIEGSENFMQLIDSPSIAKRGYTIKRIIMMHTVYIVSLHYGMDKRTWTRNA
jgi:hypothetical protein